MNEQLLRCELIDMRWFHIYLQAEERYLLQVNPIAFRLYHKNLPNKI